MPLKHACLPFHHPSTGKRHVSWSMGGEDTHSLIRPQVFSRAGDYSYSAGAAAAGGALLRSSGERNPVAA